MHAVSTNSLDSLSQHIPICQFTKPHSASIQSCMFLQVVKHWCVLM